jgi:uncharacterized protein with NRDE domain
MCLILFAHRAHRDFPLVFAANRDEFHARPTAAARFWSDAPGVLAGRDLRAGGTWMGLATDGRWAALTNVRDPMAPLDAPRSRGELVADYLREAHEPAAFVAAVAERIAEYAGFNLVVGDAESVHYLGSRSPEPRVLPPGVYGLSNDVLDSPWPKVRDGTRELQRIVRKDGKPKVGSLFEVLARTDPAPDDLLPDTGVGRDLERMLSSSFIVGADYGTRASTVLLIDATGQATFEERSFRPGPVHDGTARFRVPLGTGGGMPDSEAFSTTEGTR